MLPMSIVSVSPRITHVPDPIPFPLGRDFYRMEGGARPDGSRLKLARIYNLRFFDSFRARNSTQELCSFLTLALKPRGFPGFPQLYCTFFTPIWLAEELHTQKRLESFF